MRHHSQVLLPAMHAMVIAALPAIDALRSITAKFAMALFQVRRRPGRPGRSEVLKAACGGGQQPSAGAVPSSRAVRGAMLPYTAGEVVQQLPCLLQKLFQTL